jgi:hypothetical protein
MPMRLGLARRERRSGLTKAINPEPDFIGQLPVSALWAGPGGHIDYGDPGRILPRAERKRHCAGARPRPRAECVDKGDDECKQSAGPNGAAVCNRTVLLS